MYQEVTKALELDASVELWEVSQAVEMGKDDAVGVQVWVINGNLSSSNTPSPRGGHVVMARGSGSRPWK